MRSDPLAAALGRIARAVGETLDLKEVFARVADASATVLPFETMGVARVSGPGELTLHSFVGKEAGPPSVIRLDDFSPAIRPRRDAPLRVEDAAGLFDPCGVKTRYVDPQDLKSDRMLDLSCGWEKPVRWIRCGERTKEWFSISCCGHSQVWDDRGEQ